MRSKIIQITTVFNGRDVITNALCEDGSLWRGVTNGGAIFWTCVHAAFEKDTGGGTGGTGASLFNFPPKG